MNNQEKNKIDHDLLEYKVKMDEDIKLPEVSNYAELPPMHKNYIIIY